MFKSFEEAKKYCAENDVKMIDFKMIDLDGRWRHIAIPESRFQPSLMEDGIGFDGSSFEIGWHTHGSVMIVVPYEEILPYMETWARRKFGF